MRGETLNREAARWDRFTSLNGEVRMRWLLTFLILGIPALHAKDLSVNEIDKAEDQARNSYIQQFTKFTEDKNVMGLSTTPDGKKAGGGKKNRLNADDKNPFQSDLTYHDNSFNVPETVGGEKGEDGKNKNEKSRTLFSFVSDHGKISGAGGSSLLERTVYGLHDQFSKQDEDPNNKKNNDDDKNGIKFRSVFKIETQEVFKNDKADGGNGKAAANDKKNQEEPDKVERVSLRDEGKAAVEKVGEETFETIKRAARDEGNENDAATMPNMTFLYEAAKRASEAIWTSTLANWGQRVINRGIRGGALEKPQLSQDFASCEAWSQELNGQLAKAADNPQLRQQLQQELQRINGQCKQMAKLDYKAINPRFEQDDKNPDQEQLKTGDLNKEDGIARDSRVQLEVMATGKSASQVPSNWKYTKADDSFKLNEYDEKGEVTGERTVTIADQFNNYNSQLDDAKTGYDEVNARLGADAVPVPDLAGYYKQVGKDGVMNTNTGPTQSQMEEFGLDAAGPKKNPTTYDGLVTGGN